MNIIGLPPNPAVKIGVSSKRSVMSMARFAVRIGKAKTTRITVAREDQTKMGIFIKVIPGQRIFKIVTKKLN